MVSKRKSDPCKNGKVSLKTNMSIAIQYCKRTNLCVNGQMGMDASLTHEVNNPFGHMS